MTPERWAEIKKISTGLGTHGLLVGIIHDLIAEVERLTADNARLQAALRQAQNELAELRAMCILSGGEGLDALGKVRLGASGRPS